MLSCCAIVIPTERGTRRSGTCPVAHIDDGEAPIDALVREIREELDVEIDLSEAVRILRSWPQQDLDIEIWAVGAWIGDVVNAEPAEHDRIGWFTAAELGGLELAHPDIADACRGALHLFGQ